MRSYLEIFIDVQDGKCVEYEELRVALMFCRDMLFFTEQDLKKALSNPNDFMKQQLKEKMDKRFYTKKNPLEVWWSGDIPKIKEEATEDIPEEIKEEILKEYAEDLYEEFMQIDRFEKLITLKDVADILQIESGEK